MLTKLSNDTRIHSNKHALAYPLTQLLVSVDSHIHLYTHTPTQAGTRGAAYKQQVLTVFAALRRRVPALTYTDSTGGSGGAGKAPKKPTLPFIIARSAGGDPSDDDTYRWSGAGGAKAATAALTATVQRHTLVRSVCTHTHMHSHAHVHARVHSDMLLHISAVGVGPVYVFMPLTTNQLLLCAAVAAFFVYSVGSLRDVTVYDALIPTLNCYVVKQ